MKKLLIVGFVALALLLASCAKKQELTGAVVGVAGELPAETLCKDSDNGKNSTIKGILSIGEDSYADSCIGGLLVEYYCDGNTKSNQNIRCPNKCLNGQCV